MSEIDIKNIVLDLGKRAKKASKELALAKSEVKNAVLREASKNLIERADFILQENAKDIVNAEKKQLSSSMKDRLLLTKERIKSMADGLLIVADLEDPVGKVLLSLDRPSGINITKVSVPLGVIGIIYESRPNVTADAAALCLKSGNACILRGGSESFFSSNAIMESIKDALEKAGLTTDCALMLPITDREAVGEMLKLDKYIDVIIPRGGKSLIERITKESKIPLFKHLEGICHTYINSKADLEMAKKVIVNAKMRRTGICNATETMLIDKSILNSHLIPILDVLIDAGCVIKGDKHITSLDKRAVPAVDEDWDTEYLDAIISVKAVENVEEAIAHIANHSSGHTESIITDDIKIAEKFLNEVDSAVVMHNASTQFSDGGEFGMGAEIGISTGKLHARGPVGVEQLTSFKYLVKGQGAIRKG
ncbi:MAG: glutamate-5-semialdehyde dehydrogenase [Alphaproteobacteria bacterium]